MTKLPQWPCNPNNLGSACFGYLTYAAELDSATEQLAPDSEVFLQMAFNAIILSHRRGEVIVCIRLPKCVQKLCEG